MKGILEFNLPEEQEEFDRAASAGKYSAALFDIRQEVFRPARKHGYGRQDVHNLLTRLDEMVQDYYKQQIGWPVDEMGHPLDATHLISLLEQMFGQVLDENGVNE